MADINIDSIQSKISDWEKSERGRKRMRSTIDKYVRNNVDKTEAGSKVLNRKRIREYSNALIRAVQDAAAVCDLPVSVSANIASLKRGRTAVLSDGSYVIEFVFTDDLTRPSLEPDKYGGVQNIIAIFNNGYPADPSRSEAISHVSGWWHGEFTNALAYRQGQQFMQSAAEAFNAKYGDEFGVYAEIGEIYQS